MDIAFIASIQGVNYSQESDRAWIDFTTLDPDTGDRDHFTFETRNMAIADKLASAGLFPVKVQAKVGGRVYRGDKGSVQKLFLREAKISQLSPTSK